MLASLNFIEKFISLPKKKCELHVNGKKIDKMLFDTALIAPILTGQGFEVENIIQFGGEFDTVVVGRIERFEQHPEANRLNICFVDASEGTGQLRQIICGARNVRKGMYVAVALPGTKLPVLSPRGSTTGSSLDPGRGQSSSGKVPSRDDVTFEIKPSIIRNIKSDGMLCARSELGLSVNKDIDGDGIWDLGDDAQGGASGSYLEQNLGKPVFMTLGLEDTILDLNVTPNRPDVLSQSGVARELIAGFRYNEVSFETKSFDFSSNASVSSETILNDVKNNAQGVCAGLKFEAFNYIQANAFFVLIELTTKQNHTPAWLRNLLEPLNQNSINLIVDISNFILVAYGQPNHAFDLDKIDASNSSHKKLILRRAQVNELFDGLDSKERTLHETDCVVSDSTTVQALLGVVGGEHSKITHHTSKIVVEFANPNPATIRHTARRHNKHTVASFIFEKGIDVAARFHAAAEFTALLSHLTDHKIKYCSSIHSKDSEGTKVAQTEFEKTWLPLHESDQAKILGANLIPFSTQINILNSLGFESMSSRGLTAGSSHDILDPAVTPRGDTMVCVPSWRQNDVVGTADLVEEFVRIVGIDHVPAVPMDICATVNYDDPHWSMNQKLCTQLCALGYHEVVGLNFMRTDDYQKLNLSSSTSLGSPVEILNPVIGDEPLMQTTLIPDLLRKVERNLNYGVKAGQLFCSAKTFQKSDGPQPRETNKIAGVCFGQKTAKTWQNSGPVPWSLHDIMMHIAATAQTIGVKIDFKKLSNNAFAHTLHPKKAVEFFVKINETHSASIGWLGELHPKVKRNYGIDDDVYLFEMNLDHLLQSYHDVSPRGLTTGSRGLDSALKPRNDSGALPRFPFVSRDFCFLLNETVSANDIEKCVRTALNDVLETVVCGSLKTIQIFDIYQPRGASSSGKVTDISGNKKSVTFKVVIEPHIRSFTDQDIQAFSSCIIHAITTHLAGEQRG